MSDNDSSLVTGSGDECSLHDALADGAEAVPARVQQFLHQCKYVAQYLNKAPIATFTKNLSTHYADRAVSRHRIDW